MRHHTGYISRHLGPVLFCLLISVPVHSQAAEFQLLYEPDRLVLTHPIPRLSADGLSAGDVQWSGQSQGADAEGAPADPGAVADGSGAADNGSVTITPDLWTISILRFQYPAGPSGSAESFLFSLDDRPGPPDELAQMFAYDQSVSWVMTAAVQHPVDSVSAPLHWALSARMLCWCADRQIELSELNGIAVFSAPDNGLNISFNGTGEGTGTVSVSLRTTTPPQWKGLEVFDIRTELSLEGTDTVHADGQMHLVLAGAEAEFLSGQFTTESGGPDDISYLAGQFWSEGAAQPSN